MHSIPLKRDRFQSDRIIIRFSIVSNFTGYVLGSGCDPWVHPCATFRGFFFRVRQLFNNNNHRCTTFSRGVWALVAVPGSLNRSWRPRVKGWRTLIRIMRFRMKRGNGTHTHTHTIISGVVRKYRLVNNNS